uniref:Uncharacterized protein n=1 Tax=Oryza punctata TaxID=4537 RepID=A0A0E0LKY0_ORYPU
MEDFGPWTFCPSAHSRPHPTVAANHHFQAPLRPRRPLLPPISSPLSPPPTPPRERGESESAAAKMPATPTIIGALLGLGTQMYSNALRKLPYMRHPWEHVVGMGLGAVFVNQLVKWDEKLKEDLDKMLERAKQANERRYFVCYGLYTWFGPSVCSRRINTRLPISTAVLSDTCLAVGLSPGAVLVHRSATSSTSAIDDSSRGASGFSAGSNTCSLPGDGASTLDCTHRTMSTSPPNALSVGISPVTSSIITIPMLYTSLFSVVFKLYPHSAPPRTRRRRCDQWRPTW